MRATARVPSLEENARGGAAVLLIFISPSEISFFPLGVLEGEGFSRLREGVRRETSPRSSPSTRRGSGVLPLPASGRGSALYPSPSSGRGSVAPYASLSAGESEPPAVAISFSLRNE